MEREIVERPRAQAAGVTRYFTGRACAKGHVSERYTSSGMCCTCSELRAKANANKGLCGKVLDKTNHRCAYCGIDLAIAKKSTHIDHIIPYSKGGETEIDNLYAACTSCNLLKMSRTLEEFRGFLSYKLDGKPHRIAQDVIKYLESKGIAMPEPPEYKFYFERMESIG